MTILGDRPLRNSHVGRKIRPAHARARASLAVLLVTGAAGTLAWTVTSVVAHSMADLQTGPAALEVRAPRIVVLKSKRTLHMFDGERLVRTYHVSLGAQPVGQKTYAGDGRTPEGVFRICTRSADSRYHRFLGINYPDVRAAQRGLRTGLITYGEFNDLVRAERMGDCPAWSTALGGGIGLHGHGSAGDWTAGCIALEDAHIEELYEVLRVGDEVEILP